MKAITTINQLMDSFTTIAYIQSSERDNETKKDKQKSLIL